MTEEQERRARALSARQLAMNEGTLAALRQAGLTPDAVVALDFVFLAPNKQAAESLRSHLEASDCVNVEVKKQPGLFSRKFVVTGKSHPTTVDSELLAEWVPWMVVQGILRDCEFDGWGAEVPA